MGSMPAPPRPRPAANQTPHATESRQMCVRAACLGAHGARAATRPPSRPRSNTPPLCRPRAQACAPGRARVHTQTRACTAGSKLPSRRTAHRA
eukprot:4877524-Pleurochrysis_carterae.AAC.1